MTAAEQEWQPGDPLAPDNGCGPMPTIGMAPDQRAAVMAEGDTPPPWFRPYEVGAEQTATRCCIPCGVRWRGEAPCWVCGGGAA